MSGDVGGPAGAVTGGVGDPPVLAPVPGDPSEVRRISAGLRAEADLLLALARTLRGLGDPATTVWASPAGTAFGRRAGAVPGVVERVGHRYAVAASALRPLAGALAAAQDEVAAAQRLHEQEWRPFLRAGEQLGLAEGSADPAQRALAGQYRAQMVAHGEGVQFAVRRHAAAHEAYAVADRACAVVLQGLLHDGLADSRLYDALTGTSRVAGAVGGVVGTIAMLPPGRPLAPVAAVADGVALAADATLLVGYGDGDVGSLATGAVVAGLGASGHLLKAGARAVNATAVSAVGTRAARREQRVTAADRFGVGLADTVPGVGQGWVGRSGVRVVEAPKPRPAQPWTRPPRSAAALRPWLREQTTVRATRWASARWVDDFRTVSQAEGASVRWHVAGVAAEETAGGMDQAQWWREHQDEARHDADLRASGGRHR